MLTSKSAHCNSRINFKAIEQDDIAERNRAALNSAQRAIRKIDMLITAQLFCDARHSDKGSSTGKNLKRWTEERPSRLEASTVIKLRS